MLSTVSREGRDNFQKRGVISKNKAADRATGLSSLSRSIWQRGSGLCRVTGRFRLASACIITLYTWEGTGTMEVKSLMVS